MAALETVAASATVEASVCRRHPPSILITSLTCNLGGGGFGGGNGFGGGGFGGE